MFKSRISRLFIGSILYYLLLITDLNCASREKDSVKKVAYERRPRNPSVPYPYRKQFRPKGFILSSSNPSPSSPTPTPSVYFPRQRKRFAELGVAVSNVAASVKNVAATMFDLINVLAPGMKGPLEDLTKTLDKEKQ
ncbi:hypothetical protein NPIL_636631 [Nephila pilipes]|uniref:Uncharacterized protein n=1 Tax=Nephila pilipes TaxID=299642 RepID=A0A8X6TX27_NEPPI|nr:hypothetical protein NPIL_636631 [Nephila pilipes]